MAGAFDTLSIPSLSKGTLRMAHNNGYLTANNSYGEVNVITRKHFVGLTSAAAAAATVWPTFAAEATPDARIDIEEVDWEVRPGLSVRTKTYNGSIPGPVLRFPKGRHVALSVHNHTGQAQSIHWHGIIASPAADGTVELGSPSVQPHSSQTYSFKTTPAGTRWYHSHYGDGLFSGMFGALLIEPRSERADYDQDVVLMLHEFKQTIPAAGTMSDDRPAGSPTLTAPAMEMGDMSSMAGPNMSMRDARYEAFAINGKSLGAGNPIKVKNRERVRFRFINASATLTHRIALPGHTFAITHLDGNPVPKSRRLDAVELGPGERVDAVVAMERPGIWILGSTVDEYRTKGSGIVVEYAGAHGAPQWHDGASDVFRYESFGTGGDSPKYDGAFDFVLRKSTATPDAWSINGQRFPNSKSLLIHRGSTYRMRFRNMSMMEHPMHVHGHLGELIAVDGMPTRGVVKDTVVVRPMMGSADIIVRADNPYGGRFLLHCHNQQHVDGGMATVLEYV